MKLKPFCELIGLSKEKLDEALAPIRARQVEAQANLEMSKLDEKLISGEARVQELCAAKTIDFPLLLRELDDIALTERRLKQYKKILAELFPTAWQTITTAPPAYPPSS